MCVGDARYVSPDDMAAKYARVMASSLYTLTYLVGKAKIKQDGMKSNGSDNIITAIHRCFT
jgi:hypothetical protein